MAHRPDGKPFLSIVRDSLEPATEVPSEPVVLGFFVAQALQKAGLADAVLEMRRSPANWVDFLVQLHKFLEEGSVG